MTARIIVDLGEAFASSILSETHQRLVYFDDEVFNTGPNDVLSFNSFTHFTLRTPQYDFDGSGEGGQLADLDAIWNAMLPRMERVLESFDISGLLPKS